jgi:hypothetical protein
MNVTTIVVTRNKACHVKTLHTLLRINLICMHHGHHHNINFVVDDPFEKSACILKHMKTCDRLLFIDYSIFIDHPTCDKIFTKFEKFDCLVFPCVKEGVDWESFKRKIAKSTTEPIDQLALEFDTSVSHQISESMYKVVKTDPKCWVMDCKPVLKNLRERKGEGIKIPARNSELFDKLIEKGVKIYAWTAAKLVVTYPHECVSNILESAGVKTS